MVCTPKAAWERFASGTKPGTTQLTEQPPATCVVIVTLSDITRARLLNFHSTLNKLTKTQETKNKAANGCKELEPYYLCTNTELVSFASKF